jgi:protein O-mannosyl-transferase
MDNGRWKVIGPSRSWLLALLLLAATFAAYQPFWRIGYVWGEGIDQDLRSWQGMCHIWTQQGQPTPEGQNVGPGKGYYPLTYTTYWLEYHLWGLNPLGYHLDNILLQGLNAVVLWLILKRLSVPGAWLGAALWALHPVNVESVAWIVERKNTLSGFFYLCSLLAALKYWLPAEKEGEGLRGELSSEGGRNPYPVSAAPVEVQHGPIQYYWVALILYVLSLLSKTTTIPLPAVVLFLVWWKRGWVLWRDVRPLLSFAVFGMAMTLDTMHVEHNYSKWEGNFSPYFALSLVDRFLIAGRDLWFYLGKLLWPHPLIFNYPRWKIDPTSAMAWLQVLAVPVLLGIFWFKRLSWGRPALVALLYFLILLAPSLSFLNAMFFRRSFVADHYQYLACMGPLTLAAAGIVTFFARLGKIGRVIKPVLCASLLAALGIMTWNQCYEHADPETLYRTTLALNPDAWLIRKQLANFLIDRGEMDAADEQFRMALQTQPEANTAYGLASTLMNQGKPEEAMIYFRTALQIQPDDAMAYLGLGRADMAMGRMDDAIQNFQKVLQIRPDLPMPWYHLGLAYVQKGQLDSAISCWQKAVALQSDFAPAHGDLGNAFLLKGRIAEAIQQWQSALATDPNLESVQLSLAWVLATCPQASLRNGTEAEQLAEHVNEHTGGRNPMVLRTLAAACAEIGDFPDAVAAAQHALQDAVLQGNKQVAADLQGQLKFYQNNQPFRDATIMR